MYEFYHGDVVIGCLFLFFQLNFDSHAQYAHSVEYKVL